ncbi:MAG: hypothetical protein V5B36_18285 [Candidatus Accumulibacter sp. UW25]|jgi:hypothetical protein
MQTGTYLSIVFALLVLSLRFAGRHSSWVLAAYPVFLIAYFHISTSVFDFGRNVPFDFFRFQDIEQYFLLLTYIGLFPLTAIAGKLLAAALVAPPKGLVRPSHQPLAERPGRTRRRRLLLDLGLFVLAIAPALLIVTGAEYSDLIDRKTLKIDFEDSRVLVYADSIFWISIMAAPFISLSGLRFAGLFLVVLAYAAAGERQAAVALVLYVIVDRFVLKRRNNLLQVSLLLFAAWLLTVLMAIRSDWTGGISIVTSHLLMPTFDNLGWLPFALNYMTNYGVVVNQIGLFGPDVAGWAFFYAINPLPSFMLSAADEFIWYSRLQANVPFPGFAFALNYLGPWVYFGSVFATFFLFDLGRNLWVRRRQYWESVAYSAWAIIPFLFSIQYNLRACSRLFILLFVVYLIVVAVSKRGVVGRAAVAGIS